MGQVDRVREKEIQVNPRVCACEGGGAARGGCEAGGQREFRRAGCAKLSAEHGGVVRLLCIHDINSNKQYIFTRYMHHMVCPMYCVCYVLCMVWSVLCIVSVMYCVWFGLFYVFVCDVFCMVWSVLCIVSLSQNTTEKNDLRSALRRTEEQLDKMHSQVGRPLHPPLSPANALETH